MTTDRLGRLMTTSQVAERTTVPEGTLRWMRHRSEGPPTAGKLGRRTVYRESDVEAWLEERLLGAQVTDTIPAEIADRVLNAFGTVARWTVSQYNIHDTERMVFGSVTHYPELVHKQDGDEWTAYVLCRGACLEAHYPTAEAAIDAAEQWIRDRTPETEAAQIAPLDPWQTMPCGHARGEIHPAECGDVA